jgi:hypothetical protein
MAKRRRAPRMLFKAMPYSLSILSIPTIRRLPSSHSPSPSLIVQGGGSGLLKRTPAVFSAGPR